MYMFCEGVLGNFMKKTFIILLTFLYLGSVIGFGTAHHHCQNEVETGVCCAGQCCMNDFVPESRPAHSSPEKTDADSCCSTDDEAMPVMADGLNTSLKCCQIHHTYNQTDSSPLPIIIEVSQVENTEGKYVYFQQDIQKFDVLTLPEFSEPSTHVNLPLLI